MRELPHRLVFLDETSVRTGLTRLRGRCPRGERLYGSAPFGRWHSQTFVAGLTCDELIAPWIIPGAMDGDAFDTYVETQLAPALDRDHSRALLRERTRPLSVPAVFLRVRLAGAVGARLEHLVAATLERRELLRRLHPGDERILLRGVGEVPLRLLREHLAHERERLRPVLQEALLLLDDAGGDLDQRLVARTQAFESISSIMLNRYRCPFSIVARTPGSESVRCIT